MTWLDLTTKQHRKVHKYVNWDTLHPSLKNSPVQSPDSILLCNAHFGSILEIHPSPTLHFFIENKWITEINLGCKSYYIGSENNGLKNILQTVWSWYLSHPRLLFWQLLLKQTHFLTLLFSVSFSFLFLAVRTYLRQTKTLCSSCRDATTTAIGIHLPQMFWLEINQDSSMTEGTEQVECEWTLQWEWNSMLGVYRNIANKTPLLAFSYCLLHRVDDISVHSVQFWATLFNTHRSIPDSTVMLTSSELCWCM